jgi:hypothetical protein
MPEPFCLIPSLRRRFNQSWTPEKYGRFLGLIERRCGSAPLFRHSETPVFLPAELVDRMARYGEEMVAQLLGNAEYLRAASEAIPEIYRVPKEAGYPLFVQADFGLDENLAPQLVEIQGFPSLYGYQPTMVAAYREAYGIDASLPSLPGGLTEAQYWDMLRRAIVADCDPSTVVLMEVDPDHQKTRHDFVETERMLGVRAVDLRAVRKRGPRLFYDRDGVETPIRRIYNRMIFDELERRGIAAPFDFRDDLDVEWAGHPSWFFKLSKFSLPWLRHPAVPRSEFLDQAGPIERPEELVLKPLYSFAGVGVIVGPTAEQIATVPAPQRHNYLLQRRVDFRPVIETPHGATKIEVRIMYLWLDRLTPVNMIIRMGRGAQIGVDHNKDREWVGGSAAFLGEEQSA